MNTTLPSKPSALIRVALADLRKVESDPRYVVDMEYWHSPWRRSGLMGCSVCLAGSIMAKTLNVSPRVFRSPGMFDNGAEAALIALNEFRVGGVYEGLSTMQICYDEDKIPEMVDVRDYDEDREGFHQDMEQLAGLLESHGH